MSNILKKHELEKKKLEDEVERLRTELKDQNHNTSISFSKASSFQTQNKRNNSESKIYTQTSSISKETVEECLAKFSKIDYKPRETP
jgi:dynactin complex subunit